MFLANENFPRPSTIILREKGFTEKGFTIKSTQEDSPGITDPEVIEIALKLNLIILTFDSDYGELIFKYAIPHQCCTSEKKEINLNLRLWHSYLY